VPAPTFRAMLGRDKVVSNAFEAIAKGQVHADSQRQFQQSVDPQRVKAQAEEGDLRRICEHPCLVLKAARRQFFQIRLEHSVIKVEGAVAVHQHQDGVHYCGEPVQAVGSMAQLQRINTGSTSACSKTAIVHGADENLRDCWKFAADNFHCARERVCCNQSRVA